MEVIIVTQIALNSTIGQKDGGGQISVSIAFDTKDMIRYPHQQDDELNRIVKMAMEAAKLMVLD